MSQQDWVSLVSWQEVSTLAERMCEVVVPFKIQLVYSFHLWVIECATGQTQKAHCWRTAT